MLTLKNIRGILQTWVGELVTVQIVFTAEYRLALDAFVSLEHTMSITYVACEIAYVAECLTTFITCNDNHIERN